MEFNKIFAAILVAGIVASLSGFVSKKLVHPHELKENAVKIDVPDAPAGGGAKKEKLPEPVLALIADADIARGQKLSKACAACHSFDKGGANGVGPNMYNIVGAKKQNKSGFSYSGVLADRGGDVWTYAELNKFLWKPKWYAKGTKMNYLGLKKPEDRAAILKYLASLGGAPAPSSNEISAELLELAPVSGERKDELKDAVKKIEDAAKSLEGGH